MSVETARINLASLQDVRDLISCEWSCWRLCDSRRLQMARRILGNPTANHAQTEKMPGTPPASYELRFSCWSTKRGTDVPNRCRSFRREEARTAQRTPAAAERATGIYTALVRVGFEPQRQQETFLISNSGLVPSGPTRIGPDKQASRGFGPRVAMPLLGCCLFRALAPPRPPHPKGHCGFVKLPLDRIDRASVIEPEHFI